MAHHTSVPTPRNDPAAPRLASAETFGLTVLVVIVLALGALAHLALVPRFEQAALPLGDIPGGRVEYLQDHAGNLTLADVANGAAAQRFQPLAEARTDRTLRRVPGSRVNWLRLTIPNQEPNPAVRVLQFANRGIEDAEIFLAPADAQPQSVKPIARTGSRVDMSQRSIRTHLPAFAATLAPQHTSVLYVRNAGDSDAPTGVFFWRSLEDFRRHERRELLPLAAYLALCGVLLVYHAIAGIVFHERTLPFLCFYLASAIALTLFASNLTAWAFAGPAGLAREATVLGLAGLVGFARVQFARALLESRQRSRIVDSTLRFFLWLLVAAAAAGPALLMIPEALPLVKRFVIAASLASAVLLPLAAAYTGARGFRIAPLAAVAFVCLAVGAGAVALGHFGIIAPDRTGGAPLLIGSALEFLLLGAAVLFRQRTQREEIDHAQATHVARMERAAADAKGDVLSLAHQLTQSKNDKGRLLELIAQDVRAPLASLLAVSRSLPSDRAAEHLPIMRRRCSALIELLNTLIDWGRLRTGQFAHEPAPFQLAPLADNALRPLEASSLDKGIRLERRIPTGIKVRADSEAMACVLRNLVGNAVKFTATGGNILVEAHAPGPNQVELRVHDNGVGMTAEQLARLTAATVPAQVPATPGTAGETGIGLGLAVTRELLERENGTLRFESTLGRGTVVIATLPGETTAVPTPSVNAVPRVTAAALS